jgi:hypothetical protein
VSIKQLRLDNHHYLFVVNSANEACRIRLTGLPHNTEILNALTKQAAAIADSELSLNGYDVQIFTWSDNAIESDKSTVSKGLH